MAGVKVYVYSVRQIPTGGFVDREEALHACAKAGSMPFEGLSRYPGNVDGGLLSPEERNAIIAVRLFCKKNNRQFEVVDLAELNFLSKLRLKRRGIRSFPTIACGEKKFYGVPTEKELENLTT